jgi:hypothetical protein
VKKGFAVLLALFALTLLGALVTTIIFAAHEETRASRAQLRTESVMAVAETAVAESIRSSDWNAMLALRAGQFSKRTLLQESASATVIIARLDSTCFWIQADAVDGVITTNISLARRRLGVTIEVVRDSSGAAKVLPVPYRSWVELF